MTREHIRRTALTARATTESMFNAAVKRAKAAGSHTPIGDATEHLVSTDHFKETNR